MTRKLDVHLINNKNKWLYITICFLIILLISIGLITCHKSQKELKRQIAINYLTTICDEMNSLSIDSIHTDYNDMIIEKINIYLRKKIEILSLIRDNDLDDSYLEKYNMAYHYLTDLKTYYEILNTINCDINGNMSYNWLNIQKDMNKLTNERVKAKIDKSILDRIKNKCENWIIFNTLNEFKNDVMKNNDFVSTNGTITDICCYIPSDNIDIESLNSSSVTNEVYRVTFDNIMDNDADFFDAYLFYNFESVDIDLLKDALTNNKNMVFVIKYSNNQSNDMKHVISRNINVNITYMSGKLKLYLSGDITRDIEFSDLPNTEVYNIHNSF